MLVELLEVNLLLLLPSNNDDVALGHQTLVVRVVVLLFELVDKFLLGVLIFDYDYVALSHKFLIV